MEKRLPCCPSPKLLYLTAYNPEDGTAGFTAKIENPQGLVKPHCEGRQVNMLDTIIEVKPTGR